MSIEQEFTTNVRLAGMAGVIANAATDVNEGLTADNKINLNELAEMDLSQQLNTLDSALQFQDAEIGVRFTVAGIRDFAESMGLIQIEDQVEDNVDLTEAA